MDETLQAVCLSCWLKSSFIVIKALRHISLCDILLYKNMLSIVFISFHLHFVKIPKKMCCNFFLLLLLNNLFFSFVRCRCLYTCKYSPLIHVILNKSWFYFDRIILIFNGLNYLSNYNNSSFSDFNDFVRIICTR